MQILVCHMFFCASPCGLGFLKGLAILNVPNLEQSPWDPLQGFNIQETFNALPLKIRSL